MYTEETTSGSVLETLAQDLANFTVPRVSPMPCDRWLARSLLHKACRRGEVQLAWRALATLMEAAAAGIWRALAIITIEDVGVCGADVLGEIVSAGRAQRWRQAIGGDWKVAAYLVRRMCEADHDQSVCDLFHHVAENPAWANVRAEALELEADELADRLHRPGSLIDEGMLTMALGGGLAEGQRNSDPAAAFDILTEKGSCWPIIDACRAAWRITRHPLALLFPLVWTRWVVTDTHDVIDDDLPPVTLIGELPDHAIDQFTRSGIQAARRLLTVDGTLREMLDARRIPRSSQHRTVGDLIFVVEGGLLRRRLIWPIGDQLRKPVRCLADINNLGSSIPMASSHIAAKRPLIAKLRAEALINLSSA